jgi:hypothetical protein
VTFIKLKEVFFAGHKINDSIYCQCVVQLLTQVSFTEVARIHACVRFLLNIIFDFCNK